VLHPPDALSNDPIALTRDALQSGSVGNPDFTAGHLDESCFLKQACSHRDAGSSSTEKASHHVMSNRETIGVCRIVCYQKPTTQPLLQGVKAVAYAALRNLNEDGVGIAEQRIVEAPVFL